MLALERIAHAHTTDVRVSAMEHRFEWDTTATALIVLLIKAVLYWSLEFSLFTLWSSLQGSKSIAFGTTKGSYFTSASTSWASADR